MAFRVKGTLAAVTPDRITLRFLDDAGYATMECKCGTKGNLPYTERSFWASVPAHLGTDGLIPGVDYTVTLTVRRYKFRSTREENAGEEIVGAKLRVHDVKRIETHDVASQCQ